MIWPRSRFMVRICCIYIYKCKIYHKLSEDHWKLKLLGMLHKKIMMLLHAPIVLKPFTTKLNNKVFHKKVFKMKTRNISLNKQQYFIYLKRWNMILKNWHRTNLVSLKKETEYTVLQSLVLWYVTNVISPFFILFEI